MNMTITPPSSRDRSEAARETSTLEPQLARDDGGPRQRRSARDRNDDESAARSDHGRQGYEQKRMSVTTTSPPGSQAPRPGRDPKAWYMMRFWYGMRFTTWMRILARNRFDVSPSQVPRACAITGFSVANSALAALERVIYGRRIDATQPVEPPVFVLGHWRAGTTFLHELMIQDPHHTFTSTYACFAPHHFVLSDRFITPWSGFVLPERRPMDNVALGWHRPNEDEFALINLGVPSPCLSMMFPNRGEQYPSYLTLHDLSPAELEAWKQELMQFIRRVSYVDNRRIVIKSPGHTARVRTLLEMFPNAKFIHIARDPHKVYPSTLKLWKVLNMIKGLQVIRDDAWLEQYVIDSLRRMYDAYLQDRKLLRDDQLVELRYEDLVEDPKSQLRSIYERLQLGDFTRVESALDVHLADLRGYRNNNYAEDDALRQRIRREWATYFEAFGYE